MFQIVFLLILVIYILSIVILALKDKKSDGENYNIGGRSFGPITTGLSLSAGVRDASGVAIWLTFSILYGFYGLIMAGGGILGWVVLSFFAKRIKRVSAENSYVTFSDYVSGQIGPQTAKAATVAALVMSFLWSIAQLNISGQILSSIFNIPLTLSIFLISISILSYLFISGYRSIITTDKIQWFIITICLVLVLVLLVFSGKPVDTWAWSGIAAPDFLTLFAIVGIGATFVFASPDVWQRLFSSKDENSAKNGLLVGSGLFFLIAIVLVTMGIVMGSYFGGMPDGNPIFAFFELDGIPVLASAFLALFFMTAMMTTLDTQAFMFAQLVSKNVIKSKSEQDSKKHIKVILIGLFILLGLLTLTVNDIIKFLLSAVSVIAIFTPILFAEGLGILPKKKQYDKILAGISFVGLAYYFYLFFTGAYSSILMNLAPVALVTVAMVLLVGYRYFKKEKVKA